MEQDLQKRIEASRKGMGDYTRLILAFYACLLLLGAYQQYSLYSKGILHTFAPENLIILSAHHLGFTAFLSLFLYFSFNAVETLRPRSGLYLTGIVLVGVLILESGLTAYFVTNYEMPEARIESFMVIFGTSASSFISATLTLLTAVLCFYGLYKWSAPMQQWMGRVYPFTLAIFSLFLATMLERSEPLTENKTKYFFVDWYKRTVNFTDNGIRFSKNTIGLDPLENIYRMEEARIWGTGKNGTFLIEHPFENSNHPVTQSFQKDPFSDLTSLEYLYLKPEKKELIQIQSTFRGRDFDAAYELAREMSYRGERQQALELCQYILSEAPGNPDVEILMGRILSWEGDFLRSADLLKKTIREYPQYEDAYAALLDTYYWAGDLDNSLSLHPFIKRNFKSSKILQEKMLRAEILKLEKLSNPESVKTGNSKEVPGP
jgi:tetratricopeptide (TPR) repeat protein